MFSPKKVQVIKFDGSLCQANSKDNSVLFVKVKDIITDKNAYVEIPSSHSALIIKGGSDIRYYKEGPVKIFDDKSELKDWKRGFSVEVVYLANNGKITIGWGTPNKIMFRDEASNRVVNVGASGEFDMSVYNALQFYKTTAITADEFDREAYGDMFRNIVVNLFTDIFLSVLKERRLTYDQCDAAKLQIGEDIGNVLNNKFRTEYGVEIKNFIIKRFLWSDEDKAAIEQAAAERTKQQRLREYLDTLERLYDKQPERDKFLRQLELQDKNAYDEVMKIVGDVNNVGGIKCPFCGANCKSKDMFCPSCGKRVSKDPIVCPACGKSNDHTATFCVHCGNRLSGVR